MAGKIFLSYRRGDDAAGIAIALYNQLELEQELGAGRLFMDVEGQIKPGDNFVEALKSHVDRATCCSP